MRGKGVKCEVSGAVLSKMFISVLNVDEKERFAEILKNYWSGCECGCAPICAGQCHPALIRGALNSEALSRIGLERLDSKLTESTFGRAIYKVVLENKSAKRLFRQKMIDILEWR